jgi:hypothetical protein
MSEKVTGYTLLFLGILVMGFSVFSIYMVFTAKTMPIDLFDLPGISLDLGKMAGSELPPGTQTQSLKTELVEADVINAPLNLMAHILFMGFILNAGYKLATLGVQFVRPINVKMRVNEKSVLEP